ncbi:dihydrolipoamide acetyltransferase family protein [Aeromicrobium ginsengisoli]|uniref:Dihydrolipoamide acetyltransferase component of pyruvate dehydrogenase complex n=1 Tax=Aeromicrobium ginsengisoli TaxID=363867 RepID=A0A5M4F9B2_9ACTN|nr:dihydrolipoamide acetyltransferase family protein [Aeromicrobium ginsengisoli]KAA1394342.1 2-oxo acid dehydrogenase subunit E2 [Aeromicrobium ginsengisoli]
MSERQTFVLPDLGEGLTEAEVVRWLVAVGDEVVVDQPVVEVETAKSIVEVPSPYAGRVSELHGEEGGTVAVGSPLISVEAALVPASAAETYRQEEQAGSGNVLIGYGTPEGAGSGRRRRPRSTPVAAAPASSTSVPRVSSPLVRRLAREAGVSILGITGTGVDGLITRHDVEAAIAAAAPRVESTGRAGLEVAQRTPMSGFRKAVSAALSRSRSEIPEATVWVDVDFTELFAIRAAAKAAGKPVPGLLAYLARFTVAALRAHPELNGEVDTVNDELIQYAGINLGLAVQTDRGLLAPAVLDAHRLTTTELDTEIRRITVAAREGRATQEELTGGTFTLNNYGAFNVDGSAAIINHPQVAILGFGRVIDRAWVVDGELAVRKIAQMSFVFDHRVCDGGTAAAFMRVVADAIESPGSAIANL